MKRTVIIAAIVVGVGLGAVVTRVFWDGHAALAAGDAAMARGDGAAALVAWRRAARWYAPLAPHVASAYERMEALARAADANGDTAQALEAWRAIRSSALATRSFYTPYADKLEAANQRIAELMARADTTSKKTQPERHAYHLELLERDESPSVPWTLVALAGFAAWVGGGFWLARRGVTAEDKLERRTAARAAMLIAVGLLVWLLGLYQA
jgi:hypothetical protein